MSRQVTIVIPIWKDVLSHNEEISLRQALSVLRRYKFTIITYKELDLNSVLVQFNHYGVDYSIRYFPCTYFESIAGYSKLLLTYRFYHAFRHYRYILIYQLDCFVFSDCLEAWLGKGFSYIGAPWLDGYHRAMIDSRVMGVGNGGLSLRNVKDHLKVLRNFKYINSIRPYARHVVSAEDGTMPGRFLLFLRHSTITNNTFCLFNNWERNEDQFWGHIATRFTWYTVADVSNASLFSLEVQPRRFYDESNGLPFGCHAWWTYDLPFWKPHIEKFGHKVSE